MALSRIVVFGDGSTTQWAIPFALGYIKEGDITCRVGDEVDGLGDPVYRTLTFISPEWVQVNGAVVGNTVRVVFTRTVDRDSLIVNYSDGDVINEDNMDTAQRQAIMLVHEVLDGRFEVFQADIDMGGFRLVNAGSPVDPGDIATKAYVDGRISTGQASATAAAASAAAASSSASSAAGSASSAATSLGLTVAAKDTAVAAANATAGSVTAAAGSATAAAASAAAAASSAGGASSSATAAATSATTATTQAGIATTKASDAASSATAAAGSATSAGTSAGTATTQAGIATTGATTATTQAGLATTAKNDAATYRTQAQAWAQTAEDVGVNDGVNPAGFSAYHWAKKSQAAATSISLADVKWVSKAIGEFYVVDDSIVGADIPPTNNAGYRFIKLTSGLLGSGAYNFGVLGTEIVTGSAPLVVATSVITDAGSPMNGQTVHLLNTERRFLRAGSAGTLEAAALGSHTHTGTADSAGSHGHTGTADSAGAHTHPIAGDGTSLGGVAAARLGQSNSSPSILTAQSAGAHTHSLTIVAGGAHTHPLTIAAAGGTETVVKNIGVTVFMRIR